MNSRLSSRVLAGVVASLVVAAGLASTARANIVAYWQFNGANFLGDSSGHNHTLSITSGSVSQVGDAASFSGGGGVLSANIDLTPYRQVTISWDQTGASTGIVCEHSANYNGNPGGFIVEDGGGAYIHFSDQGPNGDTYPSSTGSFSVQYNLDAANVGDIVKVFQGATQIGTNSIYQDIAPASFMNTQFNIGDRQGGGVNPFIGTIDNFKIVGTVPEPGTIVLLITGLIGMLAYAWRKRK